MKRYKAVVVGCGPRGRDHAKCFLKNSERFELAAICDQDGARLETTHGELKASPWNATVKGYKDAKEMIERERPDVFCFAMLPGVRWPLIELALKYDFIKAIAYEKPMALSLGEAEKIHTSCKARGVKTVVAHIHKYAGHWRKVKELMDRGEIGTVHTLHASSLGWAMQYSTHLVDYLLWLNGGSRAKWVVGHAHGKGKLENESHTSPDYVMAQFECENGVRCIFESGTLAPNLPPGKLNFWLDAGATVHGSDGYAQVVVGGGWRAATKTSGGLSSSSDVKFHQLEDGYQYIADLAKWLDNDECLHPCNNEVTYHGYQIVMGACLSALERRKVDLPILDTSVDIFERMKKEFPA